MIQSLLLHFFHFWPCKFKIIEAGRWDFWFKDLANFGLIFRTKKLSAVFLFWCIDLISLWFSVFVSNNGGFSDFSVQYILRPSWFCQGSYTSCSRTKTAIPKDLL